MDLAQQRKLETYNRVKSLESSLTGRLLALTYCLLMLLAASALAALVIPAVTVPYALPLLLGASTLGITLSLLNRQRRSQCRFCGGGITLVQRPFLLSAKYLAMKGYKEGAYFYTRCRWGNKPFSERWVKLSNQAKACHHCRLMEEQYRTVYEQPTPTELAKIQAKTDR